MLSDAGKMLRHAHLRGTFFFDRFARKKEKEFVAGTVLVSCKKGVEVLEGG
jgi:hypothetical protein